MSSFLPKKPKPTVIADIDEALQLGIDIAANELRRILAKAVANVPTDLEDLKRYKLHMEILTEAKKAKREGPSTTNNTLVVSKELQALPSEELVKRLKP